MKKKIEFLLLCLVLIIGTISCQKDKFLIDEKVEDINSLITLSKNWHFSKATQAIKKNEMGAYPLGPSLISWKKAIFYRDARLIMFKTEYINPNFQKFLKVVLNNDGTVKDESYLIVSFIPKNQLYFEIDQNFANAGEVINSFTGSILEYDLGNNLIKSSNYLNGHKNTKIQDFLTIKKRNKIDVEGRNEVNNSFEGDVCIDWYLNTYQYGVLINSVYVTTTCNGGACHYIPCDNPNEDGGGTTSSGELNPEDNPEAVAEICKSSFEFVGFNDRPGGWQVAGTKNIHMSIVDLTTGQFIPLTLPTIYFGLPITRSNGEYYSPEDAARFSAEAVEYAEKELLQYYHDNYTQGAIFNFINMELMYKQKINSYLQAHFSGSATLSPGTNINITNLGTAHYSWPWVGCL